MLGELFRPSPGREKVQAAIGLYRDAPHDAAGSDTINRDAFDAEAFERPLLGRDIAAVIPKAPAVPTTRTGPAFDVPVLRFAELRPLGQVHRTYLVCESPEGLLLLDQHAAHERVLYEKYRRERAGEVVRGQPLLVPVSLDASPAEAAALEAALPDLAELGFEVEPFGGTTFAIKAVPKVFMASSDLGRTVRELAHEIRQLGTTRTADAMEEALLARMSCHTAVRAGHAMTNEEIVSLLQQLDGTPFHAQCPHGRPVVVRFDTDALKEMFGRTYEGASKEGLRERFL
jgi:DNA mismatch repair protein MutL